MQPRKASDETTQLPPPPAPTARDANPWTVESAPGAASSRHRFPRRRSGVGQDPFRRRPGPSSFVVAIAIALLVAGLLFLRETAGADFEDLARVAFAMIVLVLFAVTRRRSRSRPAAHRDQGQGESR